MELVENRKALKEEYRLAVDLLNEYSEKDCISDYKVLMEFVEKLENTGISTNCELFKNDPGSYYGIQTDMLKYAGIDEDNAFPCCRIRNCRICEFRTPRIQRLCCRNDNFRRLILHCRHIPPCSDYNCLYKHCYNCSIHSASGRQNTLWSTHKQRTFETYRCNLGRTFHRCLSNCLRCGIRRCSNVDKQSHRRRHCKHYL